MNAFQKNSVWLLALLLCMAHPSFGQTSCGNPPQPGNEPDACGTCGGTVTDPRCCPGNNGGTGGSSGSGSGGGGGAGGGCESCGGGGPNPFDPYSGSVGREVHDLRLPHHVGTIPLEMSRYFASRWDAFPHITYDTPFGGGGNWRHRWQWSILDFGTNENGQERVRIIYPSGRFGNFAKTDSNALHMTFLGCTHERVSVQGTNYTLMMLDGTKHHFTKWTNGTTKLFRMEETFDPYSNRYTYVYSNGLLAAVAGPVTSQYLRFTWSPLSNSVPAGPVEFYHVDTNASEVLLAGSFGNWTPENMTQTNGVWSRVVNLNRGWHFYKFIVRYPGDTNDYWVADPDNADWTYTGSPNAPQTNSVVAVDLHQITLVQASDGRSVAYTYGAWMPAIDAVDVPLIRADYNNGTFAEYTYYPSSHDLYRKSLLRSARDPHYEGPGREILYTYQTNLYYTGQVYEEISLVTSQVLARLLVDDAIPERRIVEDAEGNQTIHDYGGTPTRTNAVGETIQVINYDNKQDFMMWKWIGPDGEIIEYQRTEHFGRATQVISSVRGTTTYTYTDNTHPFYLAREVDYAGRTNVYERDAFNRVVKHTFPDGTYEGFAYNAYGQVVTNRNRNGEIHRYEYDERGRKVKEVDPLGYETTYGYDGMDRLTAETNALGLATRYEYDWRGNVTQKTYPDNTVEHFSYNEFGQRTQTIHRTAGVSITRYDALSHIAESVDPSGQTTTFDHNPMGWLRSTISASGLAISNTYDAIGRKIRETFSSDGTYNEWHYDPDGVRTQINRMGFATTFTYTPQGWTETVTDPLGRTVSNTYNALGRRIATRNAEGGVSTYTYDLADRVVASTDCSGAVWSNTYDGVGRMLTTIDPNGIETVNAYDLDGRLVSVHIGGFQVASNRYDAIGRTIWRQNAEGLVTTHTYDAVGRILRTYMPDGTYSENIYSNTYLARSIDRAGRNTRFERDVIGRVLIQTDNGSNTVQYAYDVSGNMTNLLDQSGNRTAWIYDTENRQTRKTYHDGKTVEYTFDASGRLISKLDAGTRLTSYHYDPVGNMTNIVYPNDPGVVFQYDVMNRMIQMTDGVGTTLIAYACGDLIETTDPFGHTVAYTHDDGNRLIGVEYAGYDIGYSHDALGRISAVSGPGGEATYHYLANGRRIGLLEHGNGVETHSQYDLLMRLTNIAHITSGSSVLASYAYTYNDADLRTSLTMENAPSSARMISYDYDPVGQLAKAEGDFPGYRYGYAYDPSGNPVLQDKNGLVSSNVFNELNQNVTSAWSGVGTVWGVVNITNGTVTVNGTNAAPVSDIAFVATNLPLVQGTNIFSAVLTDPFGRADTNEVVVEVADRGYGYDAFGNLTNDGKFAYMWDDADRLVEVRAQTGELLLKNRYDGLSRRMEKIMSGQTNRYLYSAQTMGAGWLVLAVADGENILQEMYTHGPDLARTLGGAGGIGGILAVWNVSTSQSLAYHYDANGNVVRLTDTNQNVVSRYEYSPFGEVLISSGSVKARYQFSTKEYDETVGLNYYGYRFYSPTLGRWLNRDPIGERGGVNLYKFVNNDPMSKIDPRGLDTCTSTEIGRGSISADCNQLDPVERWSLDGAEFHRHPVGGPGSCKCHCVKKEITRKLCAYSQPVTVRVECRTDTCPRSTYSMTYTYNETWDDTIETPRRVIDRKVLTYAAFSQSECNLLCYGACQ